GEVEVLGVGQAREEDVDRGPPEVVGDEVLAVERRGGELLLERLDLAGCGRDVGQQTGRGGTDRGCRVDDVGDAEHALDAGDLPERVGHAGDLLDGRG